MPVSVNALLCGFVGAIAAQVAYGQSNLFILGDATRRGRHPLFNPLFFVLLGFAGGIVLGIASARFFTTSPLKAAMIGLGATVLAISVVGGANTVSRYRELYSHPPLEGPSLALDFELPPAGGS